MFYLAETSDGGEHWQQQSNSGLKVDQAGSSVFAASNSSMIAKNGHIFFGTGGIAGAKVYELSEFTICVDDCSDVDLNKDGRKNKWTAVEVPLTSNEVSSGVFSLGEKALVAVGGDYQKPNAALGSAAFWNHSLWTAAITPPHGYRSSVAYAPTQKAWITVGPNGTDLSTDDGRNWHALRPSAGEAPDADKNWNALSLPFVVGPNGRIGRLRPTAIP